VAWIPDRQLQVKEKGQEYTELWRYWEVVFLLAVLCTVSSSAASVVL
jgi:hypothetical protein